MGEQAEAMGWTAHERFGLRTLPELPAPSYRRLSILRIHRACQVAARPPVAASIM